MRNLYELTSFLFTAKTSESVTPSYFLRVIRVVSSCFKNSKLSDLILLHRQLGCELPGTRGLDSSPTLYGPEIAQLVQILHAPGSVTQS